MTSALKLVYNADTNNLILDGNIMPQIKQVLSVVSSNKKDY
jgi:hypothetical protein